MKNNPKILTALVSFALLFGLSGCLPGGGPSAPTHFYRLEYSAEPAKVTDKDVAKSPSKILVKVSSVSTLRGVRIAVADGAYELNYEEFNRWAEPLSQSVERLLVEGLRPAFDTVEGVPVPSGYKPDYRVGVTLEKLWGTKNGEIVLSASWSVTDESGNIVASGAKEFRKSGWRTGDYRQFAERVSETIPSLATAIKETLATAEAGKKISAK